MDDIIKAINEAEERAAQIKSEAVERAARIIDEARERSAEIGREAAESRAAYREERIRAAELKAEEDYNDSVSASRREAEEYARSVGKNTEVVAGKIAGRVSGGNC